MAVEVENNSSMYSFSFTGYIGYHTLELRYDREVSNVVAFEGLDPVSIQGQLSIGLAPAEPYGKLVVQESKAVDANDWSALIRSTNAIADRDVFLGVYNQNAVVAAHNYARSLWKDLYVNTANGVGDGGNVFIGGPGNVGIGTTDVGSNKLTVEGTIGARKVKVTALSPWPDYVFAPAYELPSIAKVEQYIHEHQHLPGIPAAAEVKERGVDLGEMNAKLLEKIEELTLYLIEQNKRMDLMEKELKAMQK
ncbi:hypothetical protein MKQ70_36960 [Chitinophaga sedimenti]|uniref:hypothetical protein n=1 Tax=Chitinophaga sedimenti TaxID=2033606 RepID=UPI0020061D93|nr:hypothetical protein [Chitinophaga sedimenti]MCK7560203.1 hypothetical protein [Chitinophaga sedimenti]